MLHSIKENIVINLKNIPGWSTKRKIVIIECDDWGGIRIPSKSVYDILYSKGLNVATSRFNLYDTLETKDDLARLFGVLSSVKDSEKKAAVMTPFTIVANPDFNKIRESSFSEYHYETFDQTLERYYPGDAVFDLWKEGITAGLFIPELHGREHTNVQIWLGKLREGNKELQIAFDNGFVSLDIPGVPAPASEFRAEFYFSSEDQKPFLVNAIIESVSVFKMLFGFFPKVFVPGNGIFHPDFEGVVSGTGVDFLNVSHRSPYPSVGGKLHYRHYISGQKGPDGITYYTRNCAFEPSDSRYSGIGSTMKQIAAAFRWGKPASISTHRVNFAGGINPSVRDHGLNELKKLLDSIVTKWPDVVFMSSRDALDFMKNTN